MILSTTPTIEGHPIREYRGVVTGETIIGTNFVKDFFASVRDVWSANAIMGEQQVLAQASLKGNAAHLLEERNTTMQPNRAEHR